MSKQAFALSLNGALARNTKLDLIEDEDDESEEGDQPIDEAESQQVFSLNA